MDTISIIRMDNGNSKRTATKIYSIFLISMGLPKGVFFGRFSGAKKILELFYKNRFRKVVLRLYKEVIVPETMVYRVTILFFKSCTGVLYSWKWRYTIYVLTQSLLFQ